jgi:hypothetical protein
MCSSHFSGLVLHNNFCLFLRKQMDKRQTFICTMSKCRQIKENRLGFCFPFESATYLYLRYICIFIYLSMYMLCFNIYIYISGKRKFVFPSWQTINGNQCLLYQQMCSSLVIGPSDILCSAFKILLVNVQ